MSTVSLFAERMKERALLVELCESLRRQNAELDELQEMYATAEGKVEEQNERLAEAIDDISKANALGVQSTAPLHQLALIRAELLRLNNLLEEHQRFNGLVKLCTQGKRTDNGLYTLEDEQAIVAEVERLKAEELPF